MSEQSDKSQKPAPRSIRKGAKEMLRVGQKALDYRRDLLEESQEDELKKLLGELNECIKDKHSTESDLDEKARNLDEVLTELGGDFYNKKSWLENAEMLLVAAIIVIGIRSFFIQPFIIPTNSMYPTYFGMQPYIYEEEKEDLPGIAGRTMDKLLLGASHYKLESEANGELFLVLQNQGSFSPATEYFPNGKFFVFPAPAREYVFDIGGKRHSLKVPAEFDLDSVLAKKFAGIDDLRDIPRIIPQTGGFESYGRLRLSEKIYKKGDVVLAFDVLLGDALFVDRMSYNFVRPKSGDPAVFRTAEIDKANDQLQVPRAAQIGEDKYYIKRIVGEPGDELEMKVPEEIYTNGTDLRGGTPGILYRNQKPISGNVAFERNRERVENLAKDPNATNTTDYPGYRAEGLLSNRSPLKVNAKTDTENPTGQNFYFAMGDNSPDSLDGRAWGFVPEQQLVGRALFVYYPFTKRWGISK